MSLSFSTPQPDLGTFVANLVSGRSKYQEVNSSNGSFIAGEYIITDLKTKLPVEQLEAHVRNYLVKRGFVSPQKELEEGYIRGTFSCLRYFHNQFPKNEWVVLIQVPTSKTDISLTLTLYPRQSSVEC